MIVKRIGILLVVAVVAAACGSGVDEQADTAAGLESGTTLPLEPPATTLPDEEIHDDEAAHDEGEEAHDDGAAHDEGEEHSDDLVADRTVEITMSEWSYEPGGLTVAAGETVEFVIVNEGLIEHEFRLTTEHAALEHIEAGHEGHGDDDAAASEHGHGEVILVVEAGGSDSIVVAFHEDSDFDIVACLLPDHYEAGMHAQLTLES